MMLPPMPPDPHEPPVPPPPPQKTDPTRIDVEWQANRLRDWIHTTPLSQCNAGCDTCPDWDLAYALVFLSKGKDLSDRERAALERVEGLVLDVPKPKSKHWLFRRGE